MGLKRHALATRALVQEVMQMPLSEIKEKRAKELKAEEETARGLAASRAPKRCANDGRKAYRRLIRGKNK